MKKRLREIWWRIEWALWQKLLPRKIHCWLAFMMAGALHYVKGPDLSEHWTWAMTPYPAGYPFICQYKKGLQMLLGSKRTIERVMKENDEEWDEAMKDSREMRERAQEEPFHQGPHI